MSPQRFVYDFSRKMFLILYSSNLPNFSRCSTSWDIGQNVYYNYLLTRLRHHKIWNYPYLFNQTVLLPDQKINTKT